MAKTREGGEFFTVGPDDKASDIELHTAILGDDDQHTWDPNNPRLLAERVAAVKARVKARRERAGKAVLIALFGLLSVGSLWAAPLAKLTAVYKTGKVIQANGIEKDSMRAFKTAIAEAEDAVVTKKEREALALYEQAYDLYVKVNESEAAASLEKIALLQTARAMIDVDRSLAEATMKMAEGVRAEGPTFEDAVKVHKAADLLYLNKPVVTP